MRKENLNLTEVYGVVCAVIKQVVKPSKDIEKKCSTRADANKGGRGLLT